MYLQTPEYFQKELSIPNLNDAGDAITILTQYADEYGRKCLKGALGNVLFPIFDAYVVNGVFPPKPADPDTDVVPLKWRKLVDGCDYDLDGVTYTWGGLLKTEGLFKSSLLTPFVYYYWLNGQSELLTGVGLKVVEAKNAVSINPTQKLVSVWNSFIEQYQGDSCIESAPLGYWQNGVWVIDWFGGRESVKYVSLLRFLSNNATDYPDATLYTFNDDGYGGIKNCWGL